MTRLTLARRPVLVAMLAALVPLACPLPASANSGPAARDSLPAELFAAPPATQFT